MVYDVACSRGAKHPLSESNKYVDGCANQPLLLSQPSVAGFGDTFCRMFSAAFTSAFATVPHSSQTYNPRSTRFASRFRPQHEHDLDVSRSDTRSTVMPSISALYSSICVKQSNAHE